jgi:phage head maturation protease
MKIYADIVKVDPEQKMVWGYASTTALDSQGERISKDALETALPDYMKFANVREMHQSSAVGVTKEAAIDDQGLYLAAKIVDKAAWEKVKEGVYKGFSIGGKRIEKVEDTITSLRLTEISLVDRPANPECVFDVFKAEAEESDLDKVADREDVNPKEGESKYGDVAFADAKNKKYPIDTEAHIRAAWNYINKPKNAGKYSAEDVKAIKAKIVTAWKKKIDPEGPPSAAGKVETADLTKLGEQAWDASLALPALNTLYGLFAKELQENNPDQVAALQAVIDNLKNFIANEIKEPDDDNDLAGIQPIAMADNDNDIEKAGARNARSDLDKIQGIHDHSVALGADCQGGSKKMSETQDIKKVEVLEASLLKIESENADLKKRIEELEAQPAPAKGALKAVDKIDDTDGAKSSFQPIKKADGTVDEQATVLALTKLALGQPMQLMPGGLK